MKRAAGLLLFTVVLAWLGVASTLTVGCHFSDYALITDSDGDETGFVVNTQGKAVMRPPFGQLIYIFPDKNVELVNLVDQKANGDQTLTTVSEISFGSDINFLDYTYCTPDWTGCPAITSPNPVENDDIFDYKYFPSCSGAEAITVLVAIDFREGECGNLAGNVSLADMARLLLEGKPTRQYGLDGYRFDLGARNLRTEVRFQDGARVQLPLPYAHAFVTEERQAVVRLNPHMEYAARTWHAAQERHGVGEVSVELHGVELGPFPMKLRGVPEY